MLITMLLMYKVEKHIERKIEKGVFFFELKFDVHAKYFIDKIEEGIKSSTNLNYKTNVDGGMTTWNYFVNDLDFKIISQMITSFIDSKIKLPQYVLHEAWGVRTSLFENTKKHDHKGMELSGILYLNDSNQHTYFPELDLKIKPEPGLAIFWNNLYSFGWPNFKTMHEALPPTKGKKYILTKWYRTWSLI